MTIAYHARHRRGDVTYQYHPDLTSLAQNSDCLIVACPATPETRGIVNASILDALGREGFLVNVARGSIVDQQALIAALQEGRIAGAALDVYWNEPQVPEALTKLENVVLVPHIGSSTRDIREERKRKLLANLRDHLAPR
jgi:hydroxypyruvate reductase